MRVIVTALLWKVVLILGLKEEDQHLHHHSLLSGFPGWSYSVSRNMTLLVMYLSKYNSGPYSNMILQ